MTESGDIETLRVERDEQGDVIETLIDVLDPLENQINKTSEAVKLRTKNALIERAKWQRTCEEDEDKRAMDFALSALDPVYFINTHGWTHDPRKVSVDETPRVPFVLYEQQEKFLRWLNECFVDQKKGAVTKSRDQGFSWISVAYAVWLWLFKPELNIVFGSRKAELVDKKGDPKSIFYKVRYFIESLPDHFKPEGWSLDRCSSMMKIVNPENGSTITGEGGDNMGRGNRGSIYFWDEAAFTPRAESVDGALSAVADCIIYGSTPNGECLFYEKVKNSRIRQFRMHWSDDPRKSKEWYDAIVAEFGEVIAEREYNCNHTVTSRAVAIPGKYVQAAIGLLFETYNSPGHVAAGLDVAAGGNDLSVLVKRDGPVVFDVLSLASDDNTNRTARWACGQSTDVHDLFYDGHGVGVGVGSWFSDNMMDFLFNFHAVNSSARASDREYPDGRQGPAKFINRRAELWWNVRERFQKTFLHVTEGHHYEPEEMISIPDDANLISQLSSLSFEDGAGGRLKMESKKGKKSPDFADALIYAFSGEPFIEYDDSNTVVI